MKQLLSFSAATMLLLSFAICSTVQASNAGSKLSHEDGTKITLSIGQISTDIQAVRELGSTIEVTIALDR